MAELMFAMVAGFALSLGARDQLLVADLRERLGAGAGLLVVAIASAAATASIAAWAGGLLGARLSQSAAPMFVAFALLAATVELAWPVKRRVLAEPTRSLGAIALVLFARQVSDAPRFVLAALAVVLAHPALVGLGGALGGGAAMALAGVRGARLAAFPLRAVRLGLAGATGLAALAMASRALG